MSGIPAANTGGRAPRGWHHAPRTEHPDGGGQGEWATQADVALLRKEVLQLLDERLPKKLDKDREGSGAQEETNEDEDDAVEGTRTDTQHALDVTQYKYSLEPSVWDTLWFLGGSETSPAENAMLSFMTILTIVIQGLFCIIVSESMIGQTIDQTVLNGLATWRAVVAHKVDHYDDLTGTSLVSRVCASSKFSIFAANQLQLSDDLVDFAEGRSLVYKYMLAIIALVLWSLNCFEDLFSSFDMFRALISLPRAYKTSLVTTGDTKTFMSISRTRLISMIVWMVIPKFLMAILLCYLGLVYLSYELNSVELILNVVAFAFVYQVDEIIYNLFAPRRVKLLLTRVQPLKIAVRFRSPQSWHKHVPLRGIAVLVCLVATLACAIPLVLVPNVHNAQEAYRLMCGGNLDFVYAADAATMVIRVADSTNYDEFDYYASAKSYTFRATLERTELELEETLQAVAPLEAVDYSVDSDVAELTLMIQETFDEANERQYCKDFTDPDRSLEASQTKLAFKQAFPDADDCDYFTGLTCDKLAKVFCPETCRCYVDTPTLIPAIANREGCPAACNTLMEADFAEKVVFMLEWEGDCQDTTDVSDFQAYFEEIHQLVADGEIVRNPLVCATDCVAGPDTIAYYDGVDLSAINLGEVANLSMQPWHEVPGPLFSEGATYAIMPNGVPCSHGYAQITSLDSCEAASKALNMYGMEWTPFNCNTDCGNATQGCYHPVLVKGVFFNDQGIDQEACEKDAGCLLQRGRQRPICKRNETLPVNSPIELEWGLADWGRCADEPLDWMDDWDSGCATYYVQGWCNSSGGYGPNWQLAEWGTFSEQRSDGVGPDQACCRCGGGNLSQPLPTQATQWSPKPCWLINFIYGMFHLDLCEPETTHSAVLDGNLGSIKYMCPASCGYCSDPPSGQPSEFYYSVDNFGSALHNVAFSLLWLHEAGVVLNGTRQTW